MGKNPSDEQIDRLWSRYMALDDGPSCQPDHRGFARSLLAEVQLPVSSNALQGWYGALADAKRAALKAHNEWLYQKLGEIHQFLIDHDKP